MMRIPAPEDVYGLGIAKLLATAESCLDDSAVTQLSPFRRGEAAYEGAAWFAIAVLVTSGTRYLNEETDPLLALCNETGMVVRLDKHVGLLMRLQSGDIYYCRNIVGSDAERAYQAARRIGTAARWWLRMREQLPEREDA